MGEVVPFDGGTPERKAASDGQSLFTAMMDGLRERGVVPLRSQVAIAVRHGKAALEDGVAPALVLHCCLLAYRQGHPELAGKIILDATLVTPGDYLTREQYWRQRDKHALRTSTDPDAVAAREWEESQRDFQKRVLDPALEAMFGKTPGGEIERRET